MGPCSRKWTFPANGSALHKHSDDDDDDHSLKLFS